MSNYIDMVRAQYDADRAERDRLMVEVKRRGLHTAYLVLEMQNEGWDGEETLQAAAMRKLLDSPPHRYDEPGFIARYTGTCSDCRGRIVPGQRIERSGGHRRDFRHANCKEV